MASATAPHIKRDDRGVARIDETNAKVIEAVLEIYAALTYYYDNQAELDSEIACQQDEVRRPREQVGESPLVVRLQSSLVSRVSISLYMDVHVPGDH